MKRTVALLCALALLLSACSRPALQETQSVQSTGAARRTDPTTSAADSSAETAPTQTEPKQDGAIRVHTDYSAYTPYVKTPEIYTRLHEGPLDSFVPSADYGAIYPYVAAREYSSDENGYAWGYSLYGFVDQNGCILTDGLYSSVRPMRHYMDEYRLKEPSLTSFWITTRYVNPVKHYDDEYGYGWTDADARMGVISLDGSFALPEEYAGIEALQEGFVCYRDFESPDFEVYDGRGTLRFTGTQVLGPDASVSHLQFSEGYYLLCDYHDDQNEYWFLDTTGKRSFGPYASANCFQEGLACVSTDGVSCFYIDKTGAKAFDVEADWAGDFQYGVAELELPDRRVVVDRTGKRLVEASIDAWISVTANGIRVEQDGKVSLYALDGTKLLSGDGNLSFLDADTFVEKDDNSLRLFRLDGTELRYDEYDGYEEPFRMLRDGAVADGYLLHQYDLNTGDNHPLFVPRDLSSVFPLELTGYCDPDSYAAYCVSYDQITNERWYLSWDKNGWNAVNEDGVLHRIPVRTTNLSLYGARIMVLTDLACVLLDTDGNTVFSYPLNAED